MEPIQTQAEANLLLAIYGSGFVTFRRACANTSERMTVSQAVDSICRKLPGVPRAQLLRVLRWWFAAVNDVRTLPDS